MMFGFAEKMVVEFVLMQGVFMLADMMRLRCVSGTCSLLLLGSSVILIAGCARVRSNLIASTIHFNFKQTCMNLLLCGVGAEAADDTVVHRRCCRCRSPTTMGLSCKLLCVLVSSCVLWV